MECLLNVNKEYHKINFLDKFTKDLIGSFKGENVDYILRHEHAQQFQFIEGDMRNKQTCEEICKEIEEVRQ